MERRPRYVPPEEAPDENTFEHDPFIDGLSGQPPAWYYEEKTLDGEAHGDGGMDIGGDWTGEGSV